MGKKNIYLALIVDNSMFETLNYVECAVVGYHNIFNRKSFSQFNYLENFKLENNNFFNEILNLKKSNNLIKCYIPTIYGGYDTGIIIYPNQFSWCYIIPLEEDFVSKQALIVSYNYYGYTYYDKSADSEIRNFPLPFKFPSEFSQREEETIVKNGKNIFLPKKKKEPIRNINANLEENKKIPKNSIIIKQKYSYPFLRDINLIPTENLILISENGLKIEKRKNKNNLLEKIFSDIGILKNDKYKNQLNELKIEDFNLKQSDYPNIKKQFYNKLNFDDDGIEIEIITNKKDDNVINEYDIEKKEYKDQKNLTKTNFIINNNNLKINLETPYSFEEDNKAELSIDNKRRKTEININDKGIKFLINQNNNNQKNYILSECYIDYQANKNTNSISSTKYPLIRFNAEGNNNKIILEADLENGKISFKLNDNKIKIEFDKNGNGNLEFEKNLNLTIKGKINIDVDNIIIKDGEDSVPLLSKLEKLFNDTIVKHTHFCSHGKTATSTEVQKLASISNIKSKIIKTN